MAEKPEQIKKHIAALTEFEKKYGEYIRANEAEWTASLAAVSEDAPDDLGSDWSAEDWTGRTREVKMLATRADRAIKASDVALVGSGDLPTVAFDFEVNDGYFSDDGLSVPREILERIPSQISGLEIKLEEAEAGEDESAMRLLGETIEESREQDRVRRGRREEGEAKHIPQQPWKHPMGKAPEPKRPWHENPWIVTIGGGVIVGIIVLLLTNA